VTHDQTEALALSDRIVVLKLGKIQQVGSPQVIFSDPANSFVADFVGYKNAWKGKIESLKEAGKTLCATIRTDGAQIEARLSYPEGDPRRVAIQRAFEARLPVVTAIRPEDIEAGSRPNSNVFRCVADLVEYQGHANQISACIKGCEEARVDLRSTAPVAFGESFEASVDPDKVLVFAAADGVGGSP
jgi:ABC-type spermidine/putrescine transport systems, ATPase components